MLVRSEGRDRQTETATDRQADRDRGETHRHTKKQGKKIERRRKKEGGKKRREKKE